MPRSLIAIALPVFLLAALVAGCGSSSTSTTPSGSTQPTSSSGATKSGGSTATQPPSGQAPSSNSGAGGGGSGSSSSPGGVASITGYGSAAGSAQRAALTATAHSFFAALGARDYARVCEGLAAANRAQLLRFLKAAHKTGGCPAILKALIPATVPATARKAAAGTVTSVRVKGENAFVLFRPRGGPPSYLVLRREGGSWKSLNPTPGTPLGPLARAGR